MAYAQCLVQTLLHIQTFNSRVASKYISSILSVLSESMTMNLPKIPDFSEKSIELVLIHTIKPTLWKE